MKNNEVKDAINANTISKKEDVYTAKWGYFWGLSQSGEHKAQLVKEKFPTAEILTFGNHFAPFRGGAGISRNSHYYVKFKL